MQDQLSRVGPELLRQLDQARIFERHHERGRRALSIAVTHALLRAADRAVGHVLDALLLAERAHRVILVIGIEAVLHVGEREPLVHRERVQDAQILERDVARTHRLSLAGFDAGNEQPELLLGLLEIDHVVEHERVGHHAGGEGQVELLLDGGIAKRTGVFILKMRVSFERSTPSSSIALHKTG